LAGGNKTSGRRIATRERDRKALELRKAGASYEMIAVECGYSSRARAYEAVSRSLERITKEPARELVVLELERLDRMLVGIWERARVGELPYLDRVLKIMERRSAICGLDRVAPPPDDEEGPPEMAPEVAARMLHAGLGGPPSAPAAD
jgi:hypothetical protein